MRSIFWGVQPWPRFKQFFSRLRHKRNAKRWSYHATMIWLWLWLVWFVYVVCLSDAKSWKQRLFSYPGKTQCFFLETRCFRSAPCAPWKTRGLHFYPAKSLGFRCTRYIYHMCMCVCVCVFHTYQIYPQPVLLKIHLSWCPVQPGSVYPPWSTMVHHSSSKLKSVRLQCIWSHHSDGIHLLDPKGPGPCFGCFFSLWLPLRLTGVVTKKVIRWYQKRSCQVKKKINPRGFWRISVSHFQTNLHEKLPW